MSFFLHRYLSLALHCETKLIVQQLAALFPTTLERAPFDRTAPEVYPFLVHSGRVPASHTSGVKLFGAAARKRTSIRPGSRFLCVYFRPDLPDLQVVVFLGLKVSSVNQDFPDSNWGLR